MDIRPNDVPKVLYYSHSGDVSGAEISLLLTISHMNGVDAVLVAPQGDLLARAKEFSIRTIVAESCRARMSRNPLTLLRGVYGTWKAGRELKRIVRSEQADIVHANSIRAGLIGTIAVRGTGVPLFWHVRDNLPKNIVGWAVRQLASFRVDGVFVISNAIHMNFATNRRLRGKTQVVHNGIPVTEAGWDSIRSEYGVSKGQYVVGVVGQITPWKRQHDAISAFRHLKKVRPDAELWIVGEAKFRAENKQYEARLHQMVRELGIEDAVRFIGFRRDVLNVMASIDTLLLPSENEPFGRVLIEAMLTGRPVIATNGGGVPEIVIDGKTGCLVDTGDIHSMATCLELFANNPVLIQEFGAEGQRRVIDHFSADAMTAKIADGYRQQLYGHIGGFDSESAGSESPMRDGRESAILR